VVFTIVFLSIMIGILPVTYLIAQSVVFYVCALSGYAVLVWLGAVASLASLQLESIRTWQVCMFFFCIVFFVCLSVCLSVCLQVYLTVWLSTFFVCQFVCVCLSVSSSLFVFCFCFFTTAHLTRRKHTLTEMCLLYFQFSSNT